MSLTAASEIRDHLLDDRPCVAMAVFPLEQYHGHITTDLFAEGESSYFVAQRCEPVRQARDRAKVNHLRKPGSGDGNTVTYVQPENR